MRLLLHWWFERHWCVEYVRVQGLYSKTLHTYWKRSRYKFHTKKLPSCRDTLLYHNKTHNFHNVAKPYEINGILTLVTHGPVSQSLNEKYTSYNSARRMVSLASDAIFPATKYDNTIKSKWANFLINHNTHATKYCDIRWRHLRVHLNCLPSNFLYQTHQFQEPKCFLFRLGVEAKC